MQFYVYEHWRMDREEPFYVGKGKGKRAHNMHARNRHHLAIQNKVHREGFAIEVRIVLSGLSEEESFALECERIKFWRDQGIDLANLSDGGEGGSSGVPRVFTEEHKAKLRKPRTPEAIAAAVEGKRRAKEFRIANGLPPTKWHFTPEGLERKSIASKKRAGSKLTEEHKQKLSASFKGRKHSAETIEKMKKPKPPGFGAKISAIMSGKKKTPEHIEKLRKPKSEEHKAKLRRPRPPEHVAAMVEGKRRAKLAREGLQ